ncbi:hypothetical protein SAMN04488511_106271 [Pedobacter suwonensis]|uniref:DUF4149 domain-containing protein n=1 Tax=Pedobacter suwonensis TaxID=332999 RepID=A0A1I0T9B7_9SPHI|nr:hypothetical protein [Pedobacter suwonensis]SFA47616.1 hypothetical protein SAMN04488511_106271 [Pedobacter suwonensis]
MKKLIAIFCIIFWAGLIGGISFLEAPLKFQAPGITIPLGLGIGQLVFQALNKIEVILLMVILACSLPAPLKNISSILLFSVTILLMIDTFWLLPLLDERAKLVLAGHAPVRSYHHILYIIADTIKFLILITMGFLNLKSLNHEKGY